MKRVSLGSSLIVLVLAAVAGALWWGFRERPVQVDVAVIGVAGMEVTIEEDGATRVREIFRVSAPITGRLERSLLDVGDPVVRDQTIVATIRPLPPAFMDERSVTQAEAGLASAKASVALAEAELERGFAALKLAEDAYQRAQRLATSQTISQTQLEQARNDLKVALAVVGAARAQVEVAHAQVRSAEAQLIQPNDAALAENGAACCVHVRAPVSGVVLSLAAESEQVIGAGAEIAALGDPSDIEVVVDLLSTDAVSIMPGVKAQVSDWGGEPLNAVVESVDPAGFTAISALGIEEKRVNTVMRLEDVAPQLGHDFQVRVAITVWQGDDVLQVPLTAIFRQAQDWAVFVVQDGRAVLRRIEVGLFNTSHAEVLGGLAEGDRVIIYPSDRIADGVLVEALEDAGE